MESGRKQVGRSPSSSSSSLANDLFGSKDSSSSGILGSIFAPSSQAPGRDTIGSDAGVRRQDNQPNAWSGRSENTSQGREGQGQGQSSGYQNLDFIFQGERGRVQQPCHLSSSIYYGGQDVYSDPQAEQRSSSYKKDGEEDDPHSTSRGNWWKGSLYY